MTRNPYTFERVAVLRLAPFGVEHFGLDCGHLVPVDGAVEHSFSEDDEHDEEEVEAAAREMEARSLPAPVVRIVCPRCLSGWWALTPSADRLADRIPAWARLREMLPEIAPVGIAELVVESEQGALL